MPATAHVSRSAHESEGTAPDAVAVVGVGLRLPGGIRSLGDLWTALADGRDLVGEVPGDRFDVESFVADAPARAGKSYTAAAGLLDDIASFDADYFGISPKEAAQIDPQHRLVLECAVEAFDDAGIDPAALAGSDAAVVIGLSSHDYGDLQQRRLREFNAYSIAGTAACNAANRLSYFFDLRGPSQAVDTACSSALTAVHLACEALRSGRSRLSLAGGVNVLLNPAGFAGFSQASMLSPTGRCRPFSAAADGFVRAEGAGVLVLKPLSAAIEDGDRIHGVIAASAVNTDGRTAGLALPSAASQAALLEQVYVQAGIGPQDVAYVEAHGTGTQAGDPVECQALGQVLGKGRSSGPLSIGSLKSNLGHLEAASGVAGLLKGLLVLREQRIPGTLYTQPLNPSIDFGGLGLEPVAHERPLEPVGRGVVGVNSFGFGGANAHVVLAPAPDRRPVRGAGSDSADGVHALRALRAKEADRLPVVVSARTPQALNEAAHAWAEWFELKAQGDRAQEHFYDAAFTTCRRRAKHQHRIAVLAAGPADAAKSLRAVADGEAAPAAFSGSAVGRGRVGFVFSGNACQWAGMGALLLKEDAAFAQEVTAVDCVLTPLLGWSVLEELASPSDPVRWERTEVAQPVLFALQAGVVASLAGRGIEPCAVAGHSVGEVAAAYCAGVLTREQACQVISARSRAQASTAGAGRMAAVGLGQEAAGRRLAEARYAGRLVVAAVNSDRDVTVAGDREPLAQLGAALDGEGVFFRDLGLDYAFHSPAMDSLREPLKASLSGLSPLGGRIPMISTVTGGAVDGSDLGEAYWWDNVREPVRFSQALAVLTGEEVGCDVLVEIGPHPVLGAYLRRAGTGTSAIAVVPTLSRTAAGAAALQRVQAQLLVAGAPVDWEGFFPRPGRVAEVPAYPWQRERHWIGSPTWWSENAGSDEPSGSRHPLLGARQPVAEPTWRQRLDGGTAAWLADHRVAGSVVFPAAAYVDMALSAGRAVLGAPVEVRNLTIGRALTLPFDDPNADVSVSATLNTDGSFSVASRADDAGDWSEHARGRVRRLVREQPPALDLDALRSRLTGSLPVEDHYAACTRAGLPYGPAFRTLTALSTGKGEVLAAYEAVVESGPGCQAHPTVLDGALQAGLPLLAEAVEGPLVPFLPAGIDAVRCWRPMPATGVVHVRAQSVTDREAVWDMTVATADGHVALELTGCRMRRFDTGLRHAPALLADVLRAAPLEGEAGEPSPLPSPPSVWADCAGRVNELAQQWRDQPYAHAFERLLELVGHFTAAAVRELLPGQGRFTLENFLAAGVEAKHLRLLRVLLATAVEHGLLSAEDKGNWRLGRQPDPHRAFAAALDDAPGDAVTLLTYGVCGRHLTAVLRGHCDPLELLFSEADALAMRFYDSTRVVQYYGALAECVLRTALTGWPGDRPLRILEVGAGTGSLTGLLLPHLPPELTRYTFTDVSSGFFRQAQQRFAAYDFVDYQVLDLNADPGGQGFASGSFDVVIASNVLHVTEDLTASVRRIADLLADGGHLLALESHRSDLLAPIFGLLDSFWTATDPALRPESPLLARERWPGLLESCGFTDVVQTGERESPDGLLSLLHAARRCRAAGDAADLASVANEQGQDTRRWLVGSLSSATTAGGRAGEVAEVLREASAGAVGVVKIGAGSAQWSTWFGEDAAPTDVVLIAGPGSPASAQEETEEAVRHLAVLRDLSTASAQLPVGSKLNLWLVAPGVLGSLCPPPVSGPAAAVWGGARTLANEQARLTVRKIALAVPEDGAGKARVLQRLAREMLACPEQDEVLLTAGGRFTTVVRPLQPPTRPSRDNAFTLTLQEPGLRYRLGWKSRQIPVPQHGEVVVKVVAAALNYRDIMVATGLVPAGFDIPGVAPVGLECAGVVSAVGPGVTHLRVGDRVFAPGQGCFTSHVVTRTDRLMLIPRNLPYEAAVTLPVAALTVQHSLHHLARLSAGETVLVHGAAGGVGLTALQFARSVGAEVIATAGTPAKRDLLRLLGVQHVLDSRSLHFAEQIRDLTSGQGVDVVLNSLAGEAMLRSVDVLKPHGRFVELGKRDLLADTSLPLGAFLHNLSFHAVDVGPLFTDHSALADTHIAAITDAVKQGAYRPLPHRTYPAARISEAFACLQHSKHVGKVVITFDDDVPIYPGDDDLVLDARATYLITGGLSGFGAATARHLAARGARHLTLISRRGASAPEAPALLADLRAAGIQVAVHAADAAEEAAVRRILKDIEDSGRRLAGVVHAAMVLDDASLGELSDDRLHAVIAPKLTAGRLLDALTRERDLDFFVVYSSLATLVGNAWQAPYVAANHALDTLMRDRRSHGAHGLAVQWSVIADAGYVDREGRVDELEAYGLEPITAEEALAQLDGLLAHSSSPVTAVGNLKWSRLHRVLPNLAAPRTAHLLPQQSDAEATDLLHTALVDASPEQALTLVEDVLADLLAGVLQSTAERVDRTRRLDLLGMDSLMAVELTVLIRQRIGIDVPVVELAQAASLSALAQRLTSRLAKPGHS